MSQEIVIKSKKVLEKAVLKSQDKNKAKILYRNNIYCEREMASAPHCGQNLYQTVESQDIRIQKIYEGRLL